ncbi:MAG: hypothetical protein WAS27_00700 [Candidatus Saccharimonadales bacterium]
MIVRLQHRSSLETMSALGKIAIPTFAIQHVILRDVTAKTIESPAITTAVATGADAYTAAVGIAMDPFVHCTKEAETIAFRGAREFSRASGLDNTKLLAMFDKAEARMQADAPLLSEVVDEVAYCYYNEEGLCKQVRRGAAVIRAMQIFVNQHLASCEDAGTNEI